MLSSVLGTDGAISRGLTVALSYFLVVCHLPVEEADHLVVLCLELTECHLVDTSERLPLVAEVDEL